MTLDRFLVLGRESVYSIELARQLAEWNHGFCQKGEQLSHLFASDSTSGPSEHLSNKFEAFVSLATLLLFIRRLACCVDRLNPQLTPDIDCASEKGWIASLPGG